MKNSRVVHDTMILERRFVAAPEHVFSVWAAPEYNGRWNIPSHEWEAVESENDFRVGGRMVLRFGPRGDARYTAIGRYLEIQPDRRIVAAGTMSDGAELVSASLSTAEFLHEGSGTRLVYTEQSAFFGEESPADRRKGWNVNLEKLAAYLDGLRAQRAGSGQ